MCTWQALRTLVLEKKLMELDLINLFSFNSLTFLYLCLVAVLQWWGVCVLIPGDMYSVQKILKLN